MCAGNPEAPDEEKQADPTAGFAICVRMVPVTRTTSRLFAANRLPPAAPPTQAQAPASGGNNANGDSPAPDTSDSAAVKSVKPNGVASPSRGTRAAAPRQTLRMRFLRLVFKYSPRWYRHLGQLAVLDGDGIFLHRQSQDMLAGEDDASM